MNLDDIETRLRKLLEDHLLVALPGYKKDDQLILKIATSMQSNIKNSDGEFFAPNVFVIIAHPATLSVFRSDSELFTRISEALYAVGIEAGWQFTTKPSINTTADTSITKGEIRILSSFSGETTSETLGMTPDTEGEKPQEAIPNNAFLILHGTKIIPLNRAVINLGRRVDNQVVIDDPRVSRNHAQLRVIKGRFVIFDLNSTGGTYVNNQRTNQTVLYPGDVISLAGVTLIFGQDLPSTGGQSEDITSRNLVGAGDRPTAILKTGDEERDK